jgi:hypothetical protein
MYVDIQWYSTTGFQGPVVFILTTIDLQYGNFKNYIPAVKLL